MKVIAIGGGSVGAGETLALDRELVALARKPSPNLLFIPTASDDDPGYAEQVSMAYGPLGCSIETLLLWSEDASAEKAEDKFSRADLIYVGGGNTKKMIARWKELGIELMLRDHLAAGKPAGGVSAGAICWFRVGNSDWPQYEGIPSVNTARLDCLGFIDLVCCPHAARESFRLGEFREMMKSERGPGVALDDCCAIQIDGDRYRIIASIPGAFGHRVEWRNGRLLETPLGPHSDFRPLSEF